MNAIGCQSCRRVFVAMEQESSLNPKSLQGELDRLRRLEPAWQYACHEAVNGDGFGRYGSADCVVITSEKLAELQACRPAGRREAMERESSLNGNSPAGKIQVISDALNAWSLARSAAEDHGIGRLVDIDVAVITGKRLAELQTKAAKWDEHEHTNPHGCAGVGLSHSPSGELRLNFEHGPETYDSLRKHFLQLRAKFGTTDPTRMPSPVRPHGITFTAHDELPSLNAPVATNPLYGVEARPGRWKSEQIHAAPPITKEVIARGIEKMRANAGTDTPIAIQVPPHYESGPGIAARYPDATPADTIKPGPITCDLSGDWE